MASKQTAETITNHELPADDLDRVSGGLNPQPLPPSPPHPIERPNAIIFVGG